MNDGKMMADLALNGNAPEMRATAREGGGFNILCAGGSPHMWFGPTDEVSVFEWLGKRGVFVLPSLRWTGLAVDDDVAGIDICTTDGVHLRINDVSAWELHKWLGVKLGRSPREKPVATCEAAPVCACGRTREQHMTGDDAGDKPACAGSDSAPAKDEAYPRAQQTEEDRAVDRLKILEDAHGGKLMRVEDLPPRYDEVKSWMGGRYGSRNVLAVLNDERLGLKWYTRDSLISVRIRLPGQGCDNGYIGAIRHARAPRPGETWTRGNDMADGPYCKETWDRVIADAAFCDIVCPALFEDNDLLTRGLKSRKEAFKPWGLDAAGDKVETADDATYKMLRQALGRHVVSVYLNERAARAIEATSCDMDLAGAKVDDRTMAHQSTVTIGGKVYDVQLVSSARFAKSLAECRHDMSIAYAAMDEAVKAYLDEVQVLFARSPGGMFTPATFRAVRSGERVDLHVYGFAFVPMIPKGVDPAAPGADHSAVWIAGAPQPESEE